MSGRQAPRFGWLAAGVAAGAIALPHPAPASQPADLPRVLERGTPVLPDSLAALRLSGWAVVLVRFDSAGSVADARAVDPGVSDYFFGPHAAAYESAAVAAARTYRVGPGAGQTSMAGTFGLEIPFHAPPDSTAPPTGTLVGDVHDVDRRWRLSKVGICVKDARLATISRAFGNYRLEGLPVGRHEVRITTRGYEPLRRVVVVRPGVTDTLDLRLRPCAECELSRCFDIPTRASR